MGRRIRGTVMLSVVGRTARNYLVERKGFEIYRPTHHERAEMRSFWEDWLGRDPKLFADIYAANRATLDRVGDWIDEASLTGSLWRYGVPEQWNTKRQGLGRTGLNETEMEPTYSDLICFMLKELERPSYLEIGVSVGKNFLQVIERNPDAEIVGLDVERPNPRLVAQLDGDEVTFTGPTTPAETLSGEPAQVTLKHHRLNGRVIYVEGDQFADQTWESLKERKFNFIFSDGVHSPRALMDEMEHLLAKDLIARDDRFIMYWDDLVNLDMQEAFIANCDRLGQLFPNSRRGLHWIHGTYGSRRLNGWFASQLNG